MPTPKPARKARSFRLARTVLLACSVLHGLPAQAGEFVENVQPVGKGAFSVETNLSFESNTRQGANVSTWTMPTLLQFGVSDTLELRLETNAFAYQRARNATGNFDSANGFSDVSLGLNWRVMDDSEQGGAAVSVLFHVDVDSGSAVFRRNGLAPSLRGVAEWGLGGGTTLGAMAGVVFDKTATGESYERGILAVVLAKTFGDSMRGFVELAGRSLADQKYGGNVVALGTGLSYALDADTQLDSTLYVGLN